MAKVDSEAQENNNYTTLTFNGPWVEDSWWSLKPNKTVIKPLLGVRVSQVFCLSTVYEAVIFEDLSNVIEYEAIHITSEELNFNETVRDIAVFRTSDTEIRFVLDKMYDPSIFNFELVYTIDE